LNPSTIGGVSVVIPTFNRQSVLARALASVMAQTRPVDQIIVVDDGSSDDSARMVTEEFPEAHLLVQENRGVSAARNRGIELATGEWIALLDSDDEWKPQKIERQLSTLADASEARVCHTDEIWIRHHRRVNPKRKHAKFGGWIYQYCLPLCAMSPSSVLIHRSVFESVGLFDETLPACEDYDLWLRICARYPVHYLDEPLVVKYGGHPDQLSRRIWGLDRFRVRALEKSLESGVLGDEDREATLRILLEKIEILIAGAVKREKWDDVDAYRLKRQQWENQVPMESAVDS
jgi:glycosyltransferase involved in cell wall biosynthesis